MKIDWTSFYSPAHLALGACVLAFLAAAGILVKRRPRFRLLTILVCFVVVGAAGAWVWRETPRLRDVSGAPEYRHLFRTSLCLTEEVFVTKWRDGFPSAELAGVGGNTPMSVREFLDRPSDWQRTPAYVAVYGTLWSNREMPRILAYGEIGTPVRVVRVFDRYRPEHHDHLWEAHGEIKGVQADISLLLVGRGSVKTCGDSRTTTLTSRTWRLTPACSGLATLAADARR